MATLANTKVFVYLNQTKNYLLLFTTFFILWFMTKIMQKAFTVHTFCLTNYSRAKKIKYASLEMSNKTIKDVEHLTRHKSLFVDQNSNTLLGYKKTHIS